MTSERRPRPAGGGRRLAPGHHLYPGSDGTWRCALPGDRFLRLRGQDPVLRSLQGVLHGILPGPAATGLRDDLVAAQQLEQLARVGVLTDIGPGTSARHTSVIHVEGANPVAAMVVTLLESSFTVRRGPLPEDPAGVDLVISCAGWLPDARWQELDRRCAGWGVAWHMSYADGTAFAVGPCSIPGRTAAYADVRARRLAAARLPDELAGYWRYLDTMQDLPPVPWPSAGGLALVAGLLVADAIVYLAGERLAAEGCQLRVDPGRATIDRHPVLPLPSTDVADDGDAPPGSVGTVPFDRLVDPRLGLVKRVERRQPTPGTLRACVAYDAHVSASDRFADWIADRVTGGATLGDDDQARAAAVGEAVERYCGNAVPADLLVSSFDALVAGGRSAVDPRELSLYSTRQYRAPGFPLVPLTGDLEVAWVTGQDLATGDEVLVPASLVYLNYFRGDRLRQPPTNFQMFAGIAAGGDLRQAAQSALEELFERDATTIWWLSGAAARRLEPEEGSLLAHAIAGPESADLDYTFLHIPSSFDVPVVGTFIEDRARRVVALGTACRATAASAAVKALTEAVVSQRMTLGLLDPDGEVWSAARAGRAQPGPYRPYRSDRAYGDDFRSDWHDLHDLRLHLQLYLDPRMQGARLDRLRAPLGGVARFDEVASVPGEALATYLARVDGRGLRVIGVDLTTSDVRSVGLRVTRVVVPGLYCNGPGAFPLLGGRRLYEEPVSRGWRPGPLAESDLVLDPLPFA